MQAPVTQLYENTWAIEDSGVRIFVLAGTERAMVVDTGMKGLNIRSLAGGDSIHSKADRRRQSDPRRYCGGRAGRDAWAPNPDL